MADIQIVNNAQIRFSLGFVIPKGAGYAQVKLTDKLENGMSFEFDGVDAAKNIVTVFVNGTEYKSQIPSWFDVTITSTDNTNDTIQIISKLPAPSDLEGFLEAANTDTEFAIIIGVNVTDLSSLNVNTENEKMIENSYDIIAYDENGLEVDTETGALIPITVDEYILYGFGGSDTIDRTANQQVIFPVHVPTMDAYSLDATPANETETKKCMNYKITIEPSANLHLSPIAFPTPLTKEFMNNFIRVFAQSSAGNNSMMIPYQDDPAVYGYLFDMNTFVNTGKVSITIPHLDALRDHTLYAVAIMETSQELDSSVNSPVRSSASAELVTVCGTGASQTAPMVLKIADPFEVTTVLKSSYHFQTVTKTMVL